MDLSKLIALSDLPRHLPVAPNGRPYGRSTVYRWTTVGIRDQKLPYKQIGGRRYVDPADVERFFERLAEPGSVAIREKSRDPAAEDAAIAAGDRLRAKYFKGRKANGAGNVN